MISIFKNLFGKSKPKPAAPVTTLIHNHEPSMAMPSVEVLHLSLKPVVDRFSEELRGLLRSEPSEEATVALPLPTVMKQLPNGVVRMSLASLHRQAPAGVFSPLPPGDKRMVEIPLGEVFRHVSPAALQRRPDQRPFYAPPESFNLFGNTENPYEISAPDDEPPPLVLDLSEELPPPAEGSIRPSAAMMSAPIPPPRTEAEPLAPPVARSLKPPANVFPKAPAPAVVKSDLPPLVLGLAPLAGAWPEEIRKEVENLNGAATLSLPGDEVNAGLAKGKVAFTWGQIRSWIEPAPGESSVDQDTMLTLPLKIVAPAFLAVSKKAKNEQKKVTPVADIPALFTDGRAPAPAQESTPEPGATHEGTPAEEAPVPAFTEPAAEAAPEPAPVPAPAEPARLPATVGEVFGQANKDNWTPNEIVSNLARLPGVSGAIVALQEGLLVAHSLPEDVKGEVVAAFLPQIFARLNQYSGEMKLGEVDDLLFTTRGAHCQIYRLGFVYFAVLGKPGESLPWHELRILADELAKQTQTHQA